MQDYVAIEEVRWGIHSTLCTFVEVCRPGKNDEEVDGRVTKKRSRHKNGNQFQLVPSECSSEDEEAIVNRNGKSVSFTNAFSTKQHSPVDNYLTDLGSALVQNSDDEEKVYESDFEDGKKTLIDFIYQ